MSIALLLGVSLGGGPCGCGEPSAAPVPTASLAFTVLQDRADLDARRAAAKRDGVPVVVTLCADWDVQSQQIESMLERTPDLHALAVRCVHLRIDITRKDQPELRAALGMPSQAPPFLVFIDAQGHVRRALDLGGPDAATVSKLKSRLEELLSSGG